MSRVSIVIPAYNHARFLARAVDSVLAQTYPDLELIVLDDGSTDDTRAVLKSYGARLRWESQSNMGQAATLNKGWSMAAGVLLGYLSADDALLPDAVRQAVECLERHRDAVMVYPDFYQVDEEENRLRAVRTPEFSYADMLCKGICAPGPGALFRRSAFARAGGWDPALRRIPDFEFWLRLGLQGRFQRVPEVLAAYRVHPGAQSFSAVDEPRADELVRVVDGMLLRQEMPEALRARAGEARANALLMAARLHLMSGRPALACARASEAFRVDSASLFRVRSYYLIASGLMWRLRLTRA
jgi:glycosyltransferase involved in cell wall biosynthesis